MTCIDHATPVVGCVACLGRWDRAMAGRVLAEMYGVEAATLRMALGEVDRMEAVIHQAAIAVIWYTERRTADLDEAAATYEAMRALIDRLSCGYLGAFHDGEMWPDGEAMFRLHLGRCERCASALEGLMQETMATTRRM